MFSSVVRSTCSYMRAPLIVLYVYVFTLIPMPATAGENATVSALAEQAIAKYACRACHTFGAEGGGVVGPNLDQVTIRRSDEWLLKWLEDPPLVKPGTLMPKFGMDAAEREALVSYLHQFATAVKPQDIFAIHGDGAEAGEALVAAYQCFACHRILGQSGRMIYPDLSTVKQRRNRKWEKKWLNDPQSVKPGTYMPTFGFTSKEIDALVDFLYQ